ncbi:MAG: hypothetical protein LKI18_03240 [Prevotella sp.]|nr:hypothetical protein [Prevotella sp.]
MPISVSALNQLQVKSTTIVIGNLYGACSSTVWCMQLYCMVHAALLYGACSSTVWCMQLYCMVHAALFYGACSSVLWCIEQHAMHYRAN